MQAHQTLNARKSRRARLQTWSAVAAAAIVGAAVAVTEFRESLPSGSAIVDRAATLAGIAWAHPREASPRARVSTARGAPAGLVVSEGGRDVFADPAAGQASFVQPLTLTSETVTTDDAAAAPVVAEGTSSDGKIVLPVNRTRVLTTKAKYRQVSVGQPEIAEVTPLGPNTVLLTAKKPGATQVIVWDEADRSQVVDVVVSVDLEVLREQIARSFPGANVTVDALGGAIALRGFVPSLQTAEQIIAAATPYSDKVLNFMEISGGQQVMLQVRFLEMSRRASQELGINLSATLANVDKTMSFTGPSVTTKLLNPAISTLTGSDTWGSFTLDYALSALKQNNLARILAEPNVTVVSGQEASLLAGGEFPVPVPQTGAGGGSTITVEYREFGVRLNVTPIVLGNGKIRLKVAPEVSDLDFSSPVVIDNNNIPIILKRRVQSTVEMGDGQTFAIAGLMRNNVIATRNATPFLGELPVIGALFRSVRYQREETELVVLVTPRMVEPMNPGEVPEIPGLRWEHPNPVEFYLNGEFGRPSVKAPVDAVPARFRGSYGFAPPKGSDAQVASVER